MPSKLTNRASNSCDATSGLIVARNATISSAGKCGLAAGRSMMHDEAQLGKMGAPARSSCQRIDAIRRARQDDRARIVDQSWRDRRREGVVQIAFVVRASSIRHQVILPAAASPLGMIDRPEVDVAAIGQADFTEHAVDRDALARLARRGRCRCMNGDINVRVGANNPTRCPDNAASTASATRRLLLPHLLPHTRATRRWARIELERLDLRWMERWRRAHPPRVTMAPRGTARPSLVDQRPMSSPSGRPP